MMSYFPAEFFSKRLRMDFLYETFWNIVFLVLADNRFFFSKHFYLPAYVPLGAGGQHFFRTVETDKI